MSQKVTRRGSWFTVAIVVGCSDSVASCSWLTSFIVVNKSNSPLELSLTFRPLDPTGKCDLRRDYQGEFKTLSVDTLNRREEWRPFPVLDVPYSAPTCTLSVTLPPGAGFCV